MKTSIEKILTEENLRLSYENLSDINETFISEARDGIIDEYFEILQCYITNKKKKNIHTAFVAQKSGLPELTIKRFENLKTVPKISTIIKILHAVGLKLTVVPTNFTHCETQIDQ